MRTRGTGFKMPIFERTYFMDGPIDLDQIILDLLEPLETLAKRAARSAASFDNPKAGLH